MRRSASRREPSFVAALAGRAGTAAGAAVADNPVMVGTATAFMVVAFYVSANALWNQPFAHPEPLIETRMLIDRARPAPEAPPRPAVRPAPGTEVTNSVTPDTAPAFAAPAPAAPEPARTLPAGDLRTAGVQRALKDIGLYLGEVDGLTGPQTRKAVADYQRTVGMAETGEIDDRLVEALGLAPARSGGTTQAAPQAQPLPQAAPQAPAAGEGAVPMPATAPVPRPRREAAADRTATAAPAPARTASTAPVPPAPLPTAPGPAAPVAYAPAPAVESRMAGLPTAKTAGETDTRAPGGIARPAIVRVQAGLRAFGNEAIEIDGMVGERTRAAIREFQSLFGLPVTGQPDAALLAKMTEIGLVN